MRWQRFVVDQDLLDSGVVMGLLLFGHVTAGGCGSGEWADEIDDLYGPLLCDERSWPCLESCGSWET